MPCSLQLCAFSLGLKTKTAGDFDGGNSTPDYKTISRPMSFEKIYKHLKRKEYSNVAQFAQDVELVFSNAMQFNEGHTPLWEAARQLKECFAKLMSNLPTPFAVPQYAPKDPQHLSNGKIKLKVPPAHQPPWQTSASTAATSPPHTHTSLVLKVPAKDPHARASTGSSFSPIAGPSSTAAPSPANAQAQPAEHSRVAVICVGLSKKRASISKRSRKKRPRSLTTNL